MQCSFTLLEEPRAELFIPPPLSGYLQPASTPLSCSAPFQACLLQLHTPPPFPYRKVTLAMFFLVCVFSCFWDVVLAFPLELQKKLLHFATGSDRVPVGGLANLNFKIAKIDVSTDWYCTVISSLIASYSHIYPTI